jgi:hypothetical protein
MADDECGAGVAQFLHRGAAAMHFVRGVFIHGGPWHQEHDSPKGLAGTRPLMGEDVLGLICKIFTKNLILKGAI